MRCVAVIQADQPSLDTVILWDSDGRLVAFAYLDGQIKMTRPLDAATLEDAITEAQTSFQITAGQVTRITDWTALAPPAATGPAPSRWH